MNRTDFATLHAAYPELRWWTGIVIALIGACFGSFLSVCIWRIPRNEDIVFTPSHCPHCDRDIPAYRNIPIFGWLAMGGKAPCCGRPVSPRYLLLELLTAGLFVAVYLNCLANRWPLSVLIAQLFLVGLLIAITFIDIDHRIIPDEISITGVVAALIIGLGFPQSHLYGSLQYDHPLILMQDRGITYGFAALLAQRTPMLLSAPRLFVALDMFLGVIFGGGFLWLIAEFGKRIMGKRHLRLDQPVTLRLTADGFDSEDDEFAPWEDIFSRDADRLHIIGTLRTIDHPADTAPFREAAAAAGTIDVTETHLHAGETTLPLDTLGHAEIETAEWIEPREAMGFGDVKLLAVLGLFLGPGAAIFILLGSSLLGAVIGGAGALAGRFLLGGKWESQIPFGPYIAGAALLYILRGQQIIALYEQLSLRLSQTLG